MKTPWMVVSVLAVASAGSDAQTVGSLTSHETDVPVRLTGVGLVVGLDGTGDRSLGGLSGRNATTNARFVANLLRVSGIAVPPEVLRPRNVAAVAVQADISPYLRPGVRMDVRVSSLQDATSLQGGQLILTPLYSDNGDEFFVATAQGTIVVPMNGVSRFTRRRGASGVILGGGVVEADMPRPTMDSTTRLILNQPDITTASQIAAAVNGAFGDGAAAVLDPGTIGLNATASSADNVFELFAGIDSLPIVTPTTPRIIVNQADGSVGTVGTIVLRPASIVHAGITVTIGGPPSQGPPTAGLIERPEGADIRDLLAGLHTAGARPAEIATILQMLRSAGALTAEIIIQ